jgi:hypothetical protein
VKPGRRADDVLVVAFALAAGHVRRLAACIFSYSKVSPMGSSCLDDLGLDDLGLDDLGFDDVAARCGSPVCPHLDGAQANKRGCQFVEDRRVVSLSGEAHD